MMTHKNNLLLANFPSHRLTPLGYFLALLFLLSAKITNKILVLNLPYEIYHPCELKSHSLYYHYQEGVSFITFIEKVKKWFHAKVFWQTDSSFSSVPNHIDLVLNLDKFPRKTKKLAGFYQEHKEQIKMILSSRKQPA